MNEPPEKVMDKNVAGNKIRIVPAPFFAMWHINDAGYLPGDTTRNNEKDGGT